MNYVKAKVPSCSSVMGTSPRHANEIPGLAGGCRVVSVRITSSINLKHDKQSGYFYGITTCISNSFRQTNKIICVPH